MAGNVSVSMVDFAQTCYDILKSDRDVTIGVGGFTGEGKSTFATKLQKQYGEISGTKWSFNNMTWSRKELLGWIDGEGKERKGQKPEYSALLPDELISMFYKRNWYEDSQKAAVELFNKCRDRHLFIVGNVPDFWDLDSGFINRIRFYVYIPKRGVAWVFQQENNPFSTDKWNRVENRKTFRKKRHPFKVPNFVCEILFNDWEDEERIEYYNIRNEKRRNTEGQNKQKIERYADIKLQRDNLIRFVLLHDFKKFPKVEEKILADVMDMSQSAINYIKRGDR